MRRRKVPGLVDLEIKPLPDRLLQFDDQFTALACGYCGAKEYYERCSSAPLLKNIEIPTRILVAEDDPVVPIEMFEQWSMSNSVEVIRTTSGGHLGYIDRKIDRHSRWLDRCLASWVSDLSRPAANGFDCDSKDIEGAPIESV
jgi:predicted alpha/beta-fold hydrolase